MRKSRSIYEILYREDDFAGSRNIAADSEEEATDAFYAEYPEAEITDINERENCQEHEYF